MTWRTMTYTLLLFVFIVAVDQIKGNCKDTIRLNNWKENLTEEIPLQKTKDPGDIMECSVERQCQENDLLCDLLHECFKENTSDENSKETSKKCKGETFAIIPLYHFMCLTALAFNHTPAGCTNYEMVCALYSEDTASIYGTTTVLPKPTTTSPATTAAPRLNATTVTTNETTNQGSAVKGPLSDGDAGSWKTWFLVSVVLNVALVLLCLYLYRLIRRERIQALHQPSLVELNAVDRLVRDEAPQ